MRFARTGLALMVALVVSASGASAGGDYSQRKIGPDKAYDASAGSKLKRHALPGTTETNSYRFAPAPSRDETPWHRMDCDTC